LTDQDDVVDVKDDEVEIEPGDDGLPAELPAVGEEPVTTTTVEEGDPGGA
jgi:hypothetical protein